MYFFCYKFTLFFIIIPTLGALESDNKTESGLRKHYGLSFSSCADYLKVFKCLSACKSFGFQVYRLNFNCKCTCHDMKTSTILPFFRWRTNGTTRKPAKTQSVQLWHVVGTLSPPPRETTTTLTTTDPCWMFRVNTTGTDGTGKTAGNSTGTGGEERTSDGDAGTTKAGEDEGDAPDAAVTEQTEAPAEEGGAENEGGEEAAPTEEAPSK